MNDTGRPPRIAVAGSASPESGEVELARETGRLIAERGAVLVCGGLGGVMEAACRGAREAGGFTVGILPGTGASEANPHVVIPLPTGLGEARNALVAQSSDALIAIGGRLGTLSEIALALRTGIPVVSLASWDLDERRSEPFRLLEADSAKEAVEMAFAHIKV